MNDPLSPAAHWRPSMIDPYRALCAELVAIEDALSSGSVQFSNQGQALDGYSALATFRDVADRARTLLDRPVAEEPTDEELLRLAREWNSGFESIELHFAADYARVVLDKWGHQ